MRVSGWSDAHFTGRVDYGDTIRKHALGRFDQMLAETTTHPAMLISRGGRYYGTWPGLVDSLDADLLVTTDCRSVLTEVLTRRFGVTVAQVFPGFAPQHLGVTA